MGLLEWILVAIAALVIVALVLAEIFFIPGVGLLGIVGVLGFLGLGAYLIMAGETILVICYAAFCVLLFILGFVLLSRNKVMRKIELTDMVDAVAVQRPTALSEGDQGVTISRMALVGDVRINGKQFEAESESGFLDPNTPIVISTIRRDKIYVRKINN